MRNSPLKAAACVALAAACALSFFVSEHVSAQVTQAKPGDRLSPLERELLDEMNFARTRPAEYAAHLEQLKPYFKGKLYAPPGGASFSTQEGWAAVEEAIRFLRSAKPAAPFNVAEGMCSGAGELVRDQSKSGSTGHRGSDGSFCEQRLMRYGTWAAPVGENLSYGRQSARERVMELIIDDGFSSRGHRQRIMDAGHKVAGVSCGPHTSLGNVCVITMAGGFTAKGPGQKTGGSKTGASKSGASKSDAPQAPAGAVRF
jgi:uncharacterized protein YkwD